MRMACVLLVSFRVVVAQGSGGGRPATPVVQSGVVLTTGTTLPYDYDLLAPALEAAYETALVRYNVQFNPINCLYTGGCSVSAAAGETHICAYKNVDFLIGKSHWRIVKIPSASIPYLISPLNTDKLSTALCVILTNFQTEKSSLLVLFPKTSTFQV